MNSFCRITLSLLMLCCSPYIHAETDSKSIALFTTAGNRSISAIAGSLEQQLTAQGFRLDRFDSTGYDFEHPPQADLIVSVGNSSNELISKHFPASAWLTIGTGMPVSKSVKHAHLSLQQPLCRQLSLIDSISEDFTSVSIITTDKIKLKSVTRCAASMELDIRLFDREQDETIKELIDRALSSDVLLATPDIQIYNRRTIKNVLLQSYRKRIPVIGFSASFVKAGALAALHSTPKTIAAQASRLIQTYFEQGRFSSSNYSPDDFIISVNRQVSKSLSIDLPSAEMIRDHVTQRQSHE